MKLTIRSYGILLFCSVFFLFQGNAHAGPWNAKHIPAKAEGVVHIDVDKLKRSSLWGYVRGQLPKQSKSNEKLSDRIVKTLKTMNDEGIEDLIVSMITDVRSITIWGVDDEQWAMSIELPAAAAVLKALDSVAEFKKTSKQGISLFHVGDEAVLSVHKGRLIVSSKPRFVITTARLLDGKGRSLSGKKLNSLSASSSKGIILVAGFGGKLMKSISKEATSAALKTDIRSILFYAGEVSNRFFVEAEANVDSAQTASKLVAIVSGLQAMLALSDEDPDMKALLSGVRVSAKGSTLHARVEIPVKTLIDIASK